MKIPQFLTLLVSAVVVFTPQSGEAADRPAPVRVGVIQSLTGIAAENGKTVAEALQLAAEDIRSSGLAEVELLVEDDNTEPKKTVAAFEKLASQNVDLLIGASWDSMTNAILPLAARKQLVLFNTSTLIESLTMKEAQGYAFVNAATAKDEAAPFDRFLERSRPESIVILYANNAWGETQLEAYKAIARKRAANVLDEIRSTAIDFSEWNTVVARLKQRNPAVVVLLLNQNDIETFVRRSREILLKAALFGSQNLFDAFKDARSKELYAGACFTYPWEQLDSQAAFRSRYKSRFGREAMIYADNSYDALFLAVKGVLKSRHQKIALREALKSVTHTGLVGSYTWDSQNSFSLGTHSLVCVRNGGIIIEQ